MYKTCTKCKEEKWLSEFTSDKSKSDGRYHECKVCKRSKQRSSWAEKYSDKYRAVKAERRADRKQLIIEAKSAGCSFCSEAETVCLDFHHVDDTQKDYGVSAMLTFSRERILEEIAKCVVLCANCHRKVHAGIIKLSTRSSKEEHPPVERKAAIS